MRTHPQDCRALDPLRTIGFIIDRFRLAKLNGDETYAGLYSNINDMKNTWNKAVVQQTITMNEEGTSLPNEILSNTPSPTYSPNLRPSQPKKTPRLLIKKKTYCLYRSNTRMNYTYVSPLTALPPPRTGGSPSTITCQSIYPRKRNQ